MSGKKIRDFLVWKQISQQLLGAWSSYSHHLNTYIEGIQNDVQHCHSSTTPHVTLFRIRENVFFANFLPHKNLGMVLRFLCNFSQKGQDKKKKSFGEIHRSQFLLDIQMFNLESQNQYKMNKLQYISLHWG